MPIIEVPDDSVEVRAPRRHRPVMAAVAATCAGGLLAWGALEALSADLEPDPGPSPDPLTGLLPDQVATLAWTEWQAEVEIADCLTGRGYDAVPTLSAYRGEVDVVAMLLDVEAVEPAAMYRYFYLPWLEPAVGYGADRATVDQGGCVVARPVVDVHDDAAVAEAVAQAAADPDFRAYLADALWMDANRPSVVAAYLDAAEPRIGGEVGADAGPALVAAIAVAEGASTWSASGSVLGPSYGQAWGETLDGRVVVIRVEPAGTLHDEALSLWGVPQSPAACGDLQVSLSAGARLIRHEGARRGEVFDIHDALAKGWCGAIRGVA